MRKLILKKSSKVVASHADTCIIHEAWISGFCKNQYGLIVSFYWFGYTIMRYPTDLDKNRMKVPTSHTDARKIPKIWIPGILRASVWLARVSVVTIKKKS